MKKLLLPLLISSSTAIAGPFTSSDARSIAMGDTGVAASAPGTAAIFNPALLSTYAGDNNKVSVILPNIGVKAFANEDTIDAFEDIEDNDYGDQISSAVDAVNSAVSGVNEAAFDTSKVQFQSITDEFNSKLADISGEPLALNADAIFAVSRQSKNLGVSLFANANGNVETSLNIDECDRELLTHFADEVAAADDIADLASASDVPACGPRGAIAIVDGSGDLVNPDDELSSTITIAAVATAEVGISLSSQFEVGGLNLAVGLTPKVVTVTTQYARPSLQTLDDDLYDLADDLEANEEENSDFNLDVGVATQLFNDSLTIGVVAKNLISRSYETGEYTTEFDDSADNVTTKQDIEIDPQLRAGIAWQAAGLTLAADMDLTENKGYLEGNDTQYMAIGLEYNLLNTLRLRTGMRSNLSDSDDTALTAGIGLNIVAAHIDFGVQTSDNNAAAAFQFGVEF